MSGRDIGIGIGILGLMVIGYLVVAFVVGYTNSIKPVCPAGYRAISVDGSRSLIPKSDTDIITPTLDYPTCSPILSCPTSGQKWAVHADGSALTNSCETANCPCTAFQHCPAYASTLFRQYGRENRISLFQVIDPLVKEPTHPHDPYDVPYVLTPDIIAYCYLTPTTINNVWPALHLGDHCLRGTLARIKTSPSLFVCAPTQFVNKIDATTFEFDVDSYMNAYRS